MLHRRGVDTNFGRGGGGGSPHGPPFVLPPLRMGQVTSVGASHVGGNSMLEYMIVTCCSSSFLLSVPDPPSNVQGPLVYGTRNIHLSWDEPITTVDIISTLRGPPENLRYLVRVNGNYTITIDTNNVNLTASDQLQPGMLYSIEVGVPIPYMYAFLFLFQLGEFQ